MMIPLLAFLVGTVLIGGTAMLVLGRSSSTAMAIDRRLEEIAELHERPEDRRPRFQSLLGAFKRLGERAPKSPRELGTLRLRLVQAGFRRDEALTVFFGIRVGIRWCAAVLSSPQRDNLILALGGAGGGILPGMVLARRQAASTPHQAVARRRARPDDGGVEPRRQAISAPGSRVCVRSRRGTSLIARDRAASRAEPAQPGRPDRRGRPQLAGDDAIQTDKFGTSVAQALRVHSETLRTKRRQRAEEAAAKTGVKMVFPLVFCIFPAIWVVTIGPAAIKFITVLFPIVEQTGR
jgi:tight adherence protein C